MNGAPRIIPNLRWWIAGLLFASTVINYIDRQTLSVLAPFLKRDYGWSNEDYALVVVAFRIAYAVGQTASGGFLDRVGTRFGLSVTVAWYSVAAMLTSLATGLRSFAAFRFLLGAGESANWPGATKTVSEWFPKHERGWAVAWFDSGSAIGAAVAPFLVLWLYGRAGGWRPVFLLTGALGFLWLLAWRWFYESPERHPRLGEAERALILTGRGHGDADSAASLPWRKLLKMPQTWGIVLGRSLTDPVWFFISDWFAIYLVSKGIKLEQGLIAFWIPFAAADIGNFFGGGLSSWLIGRGWPVLRARKAVIVLCGIGMTLLIPSIWSVHQYSIAALFALSTFSYAAWSTMALVLPADLYPQGSVATVSGMSGTGAGIGTIASTFAIGYVADHYSFEPILIAASLIPLLATALVLLLVKKR